MTGQFEARGDAGGDGWQNAAGEVVDAATVPAMEVVMMAFAGDFVAGGLAGDLYGGEPAVGHEGVDVAINGGHADAADKGLGGGEGLIRRQGARGLLEGSANGIFLAGFSKSQGHAGEGFLHQMTIKERAIV